MWHTSVEIMRIVFKIFMYLCIAAITYLFFLKSPTLVLFIIGAYIFYRFVAGGSQHAEHQFYVKVVEELHHFNLNLIQLVQQLKRVSKELEHGEASLEANFDENLPEEDTEF
jgi:hypothetical protein